MAGLWPGGRPMPFVFTHGPWLGTCFFGFEEPIENMPQYGLEYGRVAGISALLLCTNIPALEKEPLLMNYTHVGIDLGGIIRAGCVSVRSTPGRC